MLRNKSMSLKLEIIIISLCIYWLFSGMIHCQCAVPKCLWVASAGNAKSIALSAGGAESMMLSAHAESMDTLGRQC
jgi:hypothetical protein